MSVLYVDARGGSYRRVWSLKLMRGGYDGGRVVRCVREYIREVAWMMRMGWDEREKQDGARYIALGEHNTRQR